MTPVTQCAGKKMWELDFHNYLVAKPVLYRKVLDLHEEIDIWQYRGRWVKLMSVGAVRVMVGPRGTSGKRYSHRTGPKTTRPRLLSHADRLRQKRTGWQVKLRSNLLFWRSETHAAYPEIKLDTRDVSCVATQQFRILSLGSSNIRIIPLIPNTNSCNRLTSRGNLHSNAGCSFPWPPQSLWYQTVGHKDVLWLVLVQIHYCQHVWGWCHKKIKMWTWWWKDRKVKERRKPSWGGQECVNVSSAFF